MHEFSMTSKIVEIVLGEAQKRNAKKVTSVRLTIGKLTFLGIEQVRFSYRILAENTLLKGSKLFIEEKDVVLGCPKCGFQNCPSIENDPLHRFFPSLECSKCGEKMEIVEGKECTVKSIRMVA